MFNLIVKGVAWSEGQDRFPSSRVFEYTDAELDTRFRPNGVLDIGAVSQLPTVFVEETSGRGDQVARVGRLVGGHLVGREFLLEYVYDAAIPPLTPLQVENRLHWCLDVQFNEDQSRVRAGYAANNLAIVRHIVINLLRLNTTRKASIKTKRLLAATSDQFRAELLGFMT